MSNNGTPVPPPGFRPLYLEDTVAVPPPPPGFKPMPTRIEGMAAHGSSVQETPLPPPDDVKAFQPGDVSWGLDAALGGAAVDGKILNPLGFVYRLLSRDAPNNTPESRLNEAASYVKHGTNAATGGLLSGAQGMVGWARRMSDDPQVAKVMSPLASPETRAKNSAFLKDVQESMKWGGEQLGAAQNQTAQKSAALDRDRGDNFKAFLQESLPQVGPGIMSSLPLMAATGGVSRVAGLGETAGSVLGYVIEAMGEGGDVYSEVYDREVKAGKSADQARKTAAEAADKTMLANTVYLNAKDALLNAVGGSDVTRRFLRATLGSKGTEEAKKVVENSIKSRLAQYGRWGLQRASDFISEGLLEEQVQNTIQTLAKSGKPVTLEAIKAAYLSPEAIQEGFVGGISGAIMGGASIENHTGTDTGAGQRKSPKAFDSGMYQDSDVTTFEGEYRNTPAAPVAPSQPQMKEGHVTLQMGGSTYGIDPNGMPYVLDEAGQPTTIDPQRDPNAADALEALAQAKTQAAAEMDTIIHPYNQDGSPKKARSPLEINQPVGPFPAPGGLEINGPENPTPASPRLQLAGPETTQPSQPRLEIAGPKAFEAPTEIPIHEGTADSATAALEAIREAVTAQEVAKGGDLSKKALSQRVERIIRTDPNYAGIVARLNGLQVKGALHKAQKAFESLATPPEAEATQAETPEASPVASWQQVAPKDRVHFNDLTEGQRNDIHARMAQEMDHYAKNPAEAIQKYRSIPDTMDGLLVNGDMLNHLMGAVAENPARGFQAIETAPLSVLTDAMRVYKHLKSQALDRAQAADLPVLVTVGGQGSGKTRIATDELMKGGIGAVIDAPHSDPDTLAKTINDIKARGLDAIVAYIDRDFRSSVESNLIRGMREGRVVDPSRQARDHHDAPDSLLKIADKFRNDPRVRAFHVVNQEGQRPKWIGGRLDGDGKDAAASIRNRPSQSVEDLDNAAWATYLSFLEQHRESFPADLQSELERRIPEAFRAKDGQGDRGQSGGQPLDGNPKGEPAFSEGDRSAPEGQDGRGNLPGTDEAVEPKAFTPEVTEPPKKPKRPAPEPLPLKPESAKESAKPVEKPQAEEVKPEEPQPVSETPTPDQAAGVRKVFDTFKEALAKGEKVSSRTLQDMAEATLGKGKITSSDVFDIMEAAWNAHVRDLFDYSKGEWTTERAIRTAQALEDETLMILPPQTTRDADKVLLQQFSTPTPYAFLVSWVANISPKDVVTEPSAGTGNIATQARMWGAEVHANEISDRRKQLLEMLNLGSKVTQVDAGRYGFDPLLAFKPSVVVMNPPFSSDSVSGKGKDPMLGARHIQAALSKLESGGRLVAIVGGGINKAGETDGGMSFNSQTYQKWWQEIGKKHRVRANVLVNGSLYRKFGTSFDTRILVIDKGVAVESSWMAKAIKGSVDNYTDLINLLEGVRNERTHVEPAGESRGTRPEAGQGVDSGSKSPAGPAVPGGLERESGTETTRPQGRDGSGGTSTARPNPTPEAGDRGERTPGATGSEDSKPVAPVRPDGNNESEDRLTPAPQSEVTVKEINGNREVGDGTFTTYKPERVAFEGAKPHPALLVQTSSMAAANLPDPQIKSLNLPKAMIESGAISDAQLEAALYAVNAFQRQVQIPSAVNIGGTVSWTGNQPARAGYLIGDGTGVGKTREILAVLAHEMNSGMKKAVVVSKNEDLFGELKDQMGAVGLPTDKLFLFAKSGTGPKAPKDGVTYIPYGTLKSKTKGTKESRIDQLKAWLGPNFDGLIVFDEAHMMANAVGGTSQRGKTKPSETALAGMELQRSFPQAKVLYASATAATEPRNLAYAERLGLWGDGTAFRDVGHFVDSMKRGRLGAMEMVAQDLKRRGLYISRNISFEGVDYETARHDLSPAQVEMFDYSHKVWKQIFDNLETAVANVASDEDGKPDGKIRGRYMSAFHSALQRYYDGLLTASMVPTLIDRIEQDLKNGESPVIQLTKTNEASEDRQRKKAKEDQSQSGADEIDLENIDMSPRASIMDFLNNAFPIHQWVDEVVGYKDDGTAILNKVLAKDSNGNPIVDPESAALRDAMLTEFRSMPVPESALYQIISHFGSDVVAEVTGRKERTYQKDGQRITEKVPSRKSEREAFQNGEKKILIFSEAGGTGMSYHADRGVKNQGRRVHYLLQPGWRADAAIQGLGRTHRSNQTSAPRVVLMTTNVKGQMRFISTIARRIAQLGALTKGERSAGGAGVFKAEDNLESTEAKDALLSFWGDVIEGNSESLSLDDAQNLMHFKLIKEDGNPVSDENLPPINQFLNRILSLPFEHQNEVFEEFMDKVRQFTDAATRNGTLDVGVQPIRAESAKVKSEETVYTDPISKAGTKYQNIEIQIKNKPVAWDAVPTWDQNFAGFYKNKKSGEVFYARKTQTTRRDGSVVDAFQLRGPFEHIRKREEGAIKTGEGHAWEELTQDQAQKEWTQFQQTHPQTRPDNVHMVSGVLMPIWDKLGDTVMVRRVTLDDGTTILGRQIPAQQLHQVLENLGASGSIADSLKNVTGNDVWNHVVTQGGTANAGNFLIRRGSLNYEPALEIVDASNSMTAQMKQEAAKKYGLLAQTSAGSYMLNIWAKNTPEAIAGLDKFLKDNPLRKMTQRSAGGYGQRGATTAEFLLSPVLLPARMIHWATMKGVDLAKKVVDHFQNLRTDDSRDFLEQMDAEGLESATMDHPKVAPFWVGNRRFKVEDGQPMVSDHGNWIPVQNDQFEAILNTEKATEDTGIRMLYAGLSPFEAFRDWNEARKERKSLKEAVKYEASRRDPGDLGKVEQWGDLPSRIAQRNAETFGWVYEVIKRWSDSANYHESRHADPRRAMRELDVKEASRLFEQMALDRFEKNPVATDRLRAYHAAEADIAQEKIDRAKTLLEHLDDYDAALEHMANDPKLKVEHARELPEWVKHSKDARRMLTAHLSRMNEVRAYHRKNSKDAEARGIIRSDEHLKKMGFSEKAIAAYRPYIEDFRKQLKELESYSRSLVANTELQKERQNRTMDILDALGEGNDAIKEVALYAENMMLEQQIEDAYHVARKYKEIGMREQAYVPLVRKGEYGINWVRRHSEVDEDGNEHEWETTEAFVMGKSREDVLMKAEAMKRKFPELTEDNVEQSPVMNFKQDGTQPKSTPLGTLERAASIAGLGEGVTRDLLGALETMELENNYANNFKRHLIPAVGTPGFEVDPVMSHATYTAAAAKYAAHLLYTPEIKARIASLEADGFQSGSKKASLHQDQVNYLRRLAADVFNNPVAASIVRITNLTAASGLGLNPAFVVQQFLQKMTHERPTFEAIYGKDADKYIDAGRRISSAMLKAEIAGKKGDDLWSAINPELLKGIPNAEILARDLKAKLREAEESGIFLDQIRHETVRAAHGQDTSFARGMENYQNAVFFAVAKTETHNRRQTFAAQYLLARSLGYPVRKGVDTAIDPDKLGAVHEGYEMKQLGSQAAAVLAGKQVDWIHNRRGVTNRSEIQRWGKGVGMLPTQFKYFTVEYLQQMREVYKAAYAQNRNRGESEQMAKLKAGKPVIKSLAWLLAMAGMSGLPLLSGLLDVFTLLMNELIGPALFRSNWTPWRTWHGWLNDEMVKHHAPHWLRTMVLRGVPGVIGVSMERSLGMGDQFNIRRGEDRYKTLFDLLAGASGSTVEQSFKALGKLATGDMVGAFFNLPGMPKGVRNLYSSIAEPQVNMGGGRRVDKTPGERAMMAAGFQPTRISEARSVAEDQNWAAANAKERDQWFANELAKARKEGDTKRFQELLQKRMEYNKQMMAEGRKDEASRGQAIKPAIRRELGTTRKNKAFQDRLAQ